MAHSSDLLVLQKSTIDFDYINVSFSQGEGQTKTSLPVKLWLKDAPQETCPGCEFNLSVEGEDMVSLVTVWFNEHSFSNCNVFEM